MTRVKPTPKTNSRQSGRKAHDINPQAAEEQFRSLANNMPNLAWIADPDGWIYWYNSRWYEYTGSTPAEMEGWGWESVHDPKELPRVLKLWRAGIKTGKPVEMTFPLKGADGVYRQFLTRIIPIKDEKGTVLHWFGTNTDINEQKQTQSGLELAKTKVIHEQRRLYGLFMQTPAMIAVLVGPHLKYELANPLYLKYVGKTEDIIGKRLLDVFPELVGQDILNILMNVYKTGESYVGNDVLVKLDTNNDGVAEDVYFTFVYQAIRNTNGKIQGVITHAIDVTSQVEARKKIEESEAQLRFMAESLPHKFFTADPHGKITYFNSQWSEYTGLPMQQLMAEGVRQFIHPKDLPISMSEWRHAMKTGKAMQNGQRLLRADGQYRRHISYIRAMFDKKGKIVRWFGSLTDIEDITRATARKEQLELKTEALKEQRAQLVALNTAKDEFITLASHQLRTPATAVKQFLAMLLDGYAGEVTDAQRDFLQTAYDSNERQIKVVNDLLNVATVDAGKVKLRLSKINVKSLLDEIITTNSAKFAEKRQKIIFTAPEDPCVISADAELLRMAFDNLIDNASKYSYERKSIHISLYKAKGSSIITIRDEGVGIPADKLTRLFQKFSRLDNPLSLVVGGTGVGLYWSKKIIDLHKGTIAVESKEGSGTSFTITLAC